MKNKKVKDIYGQNDLVAMTMELFEQIQMTYGLSEPKTEFITYFINVLKKYHSGVTFEQIELAFEYNAAGYLNDYLPKSGQSIDNKVKFTIPDLTKIITAFVKYKNIDESENIEKKEWSEEKIKDIHIQYINKLNDLFVNYRLNKKREVITTPIYTAEYLAKLGLIDAKKIDKKGTGLNITIGKNRVLESSNNNNLIYECFDGLIVNHENLSDYVNSFENEKEFGL